MSTKKTTVSSKKWSDLAPSYAKQNTVTIIVPKNEEDFNDKHLENDFKDVESWSFTFRNFSKEEKLTGALSAVDDDPKEQVKGIVRIFTKNIEDWSNVTVHDMFDNDDQSVIDFDPDAFDEFLAKHFWVVMPIINLVNKKIAKQKEKINEQKKT